MRTGLALLVALLVGCASEPPARGPTPPYSEAGRVVGGHLGTIVLAERCAAAFPDLAPEIDPALRDWRWRNDPIAAAVEQRMWATVVERGAKPGDVAAAKASFARELEVIAVGMEDWFASWPPERQRAYCGRVTARLALGVDDLARRYPAEVRRWHGATR
jgi:hypothetical protein